MSVDHAVPSGVDMPNEESTWTARIAHRVRTLLVRALGVDDAPLQPVVPKPEVVFDPDWYWC